MPRLLLIHTATSTCSIAISNGENILSRFDLENNNHAEFITYGIGQCMSDCGATLNDIDAVAVNGGPGSYTGLRIGLSVAKGICYTLNKPLVLIDALGIIYNGMRRIANYDWYCAVTDNRRDEIFYSIYSASGVMTVNTTLTNVDDSKIAEFIHNKCDSLLFSGSGITKLKNKFPNINVVDVPYIPEDLLISAVHQFNAGVFANVAYCEPLYHKEVYIAEAKR